MVGCTYSQVHESEIREELWTLMCTVQPREKHGHQTPERHNGSRKERRNRQGRIAISDFRWRDQEIELPSDSRTTWRKPIPVIPSVTDQMAQSRCHAIPSAHSLTHIRRNQHERRMDHGGGEKELLRKPTSLLTGQALSLQAGRQSFECLHGDISIVAPPGPLLTLRSLRVHWQSLLCFTMISECLS
jgi:hypothetical protein